ncbi:hypothetical protein HDU96_005015 [Phlyctochytrium bullatum]|nr:hypothetical protein HDU96_005015 [Phlyctochytrium bullatum]
MGPALRVKRGRPHQTFQALRWGPECSIGGGVSTTPAPGMAEMRGGPATGHVAVWLRAGDAVESVGLASLGSGLDVDMPLDAAPRRGGAPNGCNKPDCWAPPPQRSAR